MAMMKTGIAQSPAVQNPATANPNNSLVKQTTYGPYGGTVTYAGDTSNQPYRSNLATSYQSVWDNPAGGSSTSYANDSDTDVQQAQSLTDELKRAQTGNDPGADQVALSAQLDAVKARIASKNALGSAINSNADQENAAENTVRNSANAAMSSGIKNTRQNFNSRGLLYSGMRQGGEDAVRSGVAGQMAAGLEGTKSDYANLNAANKLAYSSVDLATAQHNQDLANQAFDTVTKNNVARAQAYQQLGQGLGGVIGTFAGSTRPTPSSTQTSAPQNDYSFLGTGASDGYGGTQLAATNNEYGYTG